jgi:hypothetical protein
MLYEHVGNLIMERYSWIVEQICTGPGDFHEMQRVNTNFIAMYIVATNFLCCCPLLNKELYFYNINDWLK